jgi:hypothetical protein
MYWELVQEILWQQNLKNVWLGVIIQQFIIWFLCDKISMVVEFLIRVLLRHCALLLGE